MSGLKNLLLKVGIVLFGIAFIVFGFIESSETKNFVKSTAVISQIILTGYNTDNEPEYQTMVKHTVDGVEYEGDMHEASGTFSEGKEVKIKYNPEDPTDIRGDDFFSNVGLFIAGGVFTLIGLSLLAKQIITGR